METIQWMVTGILIINVARLVLAIRSNLIITRDVKVNAEYRNKLAKDADIKLNVIKEMHLAELDAFKEAMENQSEG
jgi:hypothetical protein